MSEYKFSPHQRFAVWSTHGEKCYLCTKPVDLATCVIDHVIPERLLSRPAELEAVKKAFGRDHDFKINSYENWLPACPPCNLKKSSRLSDPVPIILVHLQCATDRAADARKVETGSLNDRALGRSLNYVLRAHEDGDLTEAHLDQLEPLVRAIVSQRAVAERSEVVRLAPALRMIFDDGRVSLVQGPYGVGGGPSASQTPSCAACGNPWFSGARCVTCGAQSDD